MRGRRSGWCRGGSRAPRRQAEATGRNGSRLPSRTPAAGKGGGRGLGSRRAARPEDSRLLRLKSEAEVTGPLQGGARVTSAGGGAGGAAEASDSRSMRSSVRRPCRSVLRSRPAGQAGGDRRGRVSVRRQQGGGTGRLPRAVAGGRGLRRPRGGAGLPTLRPAGIRRLPAPIRLRAGRPGHAPAGERPGHLAGGTPAWHGSPTSPWRSGRSDSAWGGRWEGPRSKGQRATWGRARGQPPKCEGASGAGVPTAHAPGRASLPLPTPRGGAHEGQTGWVEWLPGTRAKDQASDARVRSCRYLTQPSYLCPETVLLEATDV